MAQRIFLCGTSDTTGLNWLNLPSKVTHCFQLVKNSLETLNKGSPIPMSLNLNKRAWCFTKSKVELKSSETSLDSPRLSSDACKSCVSYNRASAVPSIFLKPNWVWDKIFSAFANLYSLLATSFSKTFDIIWVMEIDVYSSGNWVGLLPFEIGVTVAVHHDSGKIPEVKKAQKVLANLGEIKSTIFFKNKENRLSGSKPPLESSSIKKYLISEDLKAK